MTIETFILKFLSPDTGCSSHELRFLAEPETVGAILDVEPKELTTHSYYLDDSDLAGLAGIITLPLPEWTDEVMLARPHPIDRVPYLVHTNFELPLMLAGQKPFAVLTGSTDRLEQFQPYVAVGTIVERIRERRLLSSNVVEGLFALPGEEWRFDAYDALMAGPRPWTDDMERRLGTLLGYTEQECDWWLANRGVL